MFQEDNLQQHRQHIIKNLRSNQLPRALMMTRSIIILKNLRHRRRFVPKIGEIGGKGDTFGMGSVSLRIKANGHSG